MCLHVQSSFFIHHMVIFDDLSKIRGTKWVYCKAKFSMHHMMCYEALWRNTRCVRWKSSSIVSKGRHRKTYSVFCKASTRRRPGSIPECGPNKTLPRMSIFLLETPTVSFIMPSLHHFWSRRKQEVLMEKKRISCLCQCYHYEGAHFLLCIIICINTSTQTLLY